MNKSGINLWPISSNISSFRAVVLVFTRKHTGIVWSFTEGKPHQEVTWHLSQHFEIWPQPYQQVRGILPKCVQCPPDFGRLERPLGHRFRFDTTFSHLPFSATH